MTITVEVGIPPTDYDKFSVMPQRGFGLQPRVAASATLGKGGDLVLNRNAVASALCIAATLGWPRWGAFMKIPTAK